MGALYVERPADTQLVEALLGGEFCYVLAPRQIGKSSLRVRATRRLQEQGVRCATVDLTRIGGVGSTPEAWYFGLVEEIARKLKLVAPLSANPNQTRDFWQERRELTPVHRFVSFLRQEVLGRVAEPVAVFIDEIDSVLALPFPSDDFFAAIRDAYNSRAEDPAYARLTFCLMGVAAPGDLIKNPARTPFNIGRGIRLLDFTPAEAAALLPGLRQVPGDPQRLLDAVLGWTSGHPYMTQRICEVLVKRGAAPAGKDEEERVAEVVRDAFLRRGRGEEPNLTYAESRLSQSAQLVPLLRLYRRLLEGERPAASSGDPLQMELRLCGMAAEHKDESGTWLRVRNRVFATVFDAHWVKEKEVRSLLTEPLLRWQQAGKKDDFLLRGEALQEAVEWARGRQDVTSEEHEYLLAGLELARREAEERRVAAEEQRRADLERERLQRAETKAQAQRRIVALLAATVVVLSTLLGTVVWQYRKVERAEEAQRAARLAEEAAKRHAEGVSLTERGLRAALLSRQPGEEVAALITGIRAVGPYLSDHREPMAAAIAGLTAASTALASSLPLRGHSGRIPAAAFSPDGRHVVTASYDGTARLWDSTNGHALYVLRGHADRVHYAAYGPAGKRIVTTSYDGTARLWDGETGESLQTLRGHTGPVRFAAFSPDGRFVVTASDDRTARVFDTWSGQTRSVLRGHVETVLTAVFSPDGKYIATASFDRSARLWDAQSGRLLAVLAGHRERIVSAVFAPDGKRIVSAGLDRTARLWDVPSGRPLAVLAGHEGPISAALFAPDGKRVATASYDATVRLWDAQTGRPLTTLRGHGDAVLSAAFSPDGKRLVTSSEDHTARLWDLQSGRVLTTFQGHAAAVLSVSFSSSGKRLVTSSEDHTARLWLLEAGIGQAPISLKGHGDRVLAATFSPDGRRVATASFDHTARLWDAQTGKELFTLAGHSDWVLAVTFAPDSQRLLTASSDRTARLWDAHTGQLLLTLAGHDGAVLSAAFSPDGRRVLTASLDQNARLWDAHSGRLLATLRGGMAAAFSPDGKRIVTASPDRIARVYDTDSGKILTILTGHTDWVLSAAFSPDGRKVLTAGQDHTARIWDAQNTRTLAVLKGHWNSVLNASFSPDSRRVLTVSEDNTARLWDADTGRLLVTLKGQAEWVRPSVLSATFSPDSKRVLTASWDGTARIWDAATGWALATLKSQIRPLSGSDYRVVEETHVPLLYYLKGGAAAAFSPDGKRIVAVLGKSTVWIHPATPESFFGIACELLRYQPEFTHAQTAPKEFLEAEEYCAPFYYGFGELETPQPLDRPK